MIIDFAILLVVGMSIAIAAIFCGFLVRRHAKRSNNAKWEPALEPQSEAHGLGTDYPQRSGSFLSSMVHRRYAIPKDPQAYAKIFVPETKVADQRE
jgi:hypothetical protein